jgi:hypothetical protein
MSLELSKDDHTKDYAKSIKSLWKIIKNHPYISSSRLLSLEILKYDFVIKLMEPNGFLLPLLLNFQTLGPCNHYVQSNYVAQLCNNFGVRQNGDEYCRLVVVDYWDFRSVKAKKFKVHWLRLHVINLWGLWKMNELLTPLGLWNSTFTIVSLCTWTWLSIYFHNNFIHWKVSHMYKLYIHGRIRKLDIDVNINAFFSRGLLLVALLAFLNVVISKLSPWGSTCVLFHVG